MLYLHNVMGAQYGPKVLVTVGYNCVWELYVWPIEGYCTNPINYRINWYRILADNYIHIWPSLAGITSITCP